MYTRQHGVVVLCFGIAVEIRDVRGKAGVVEQKHFYGDACAPGWIGIGFRGRGPFGHEAHDGRIETQFAALNQPHDGRGGDDRLGERGHVIDGVGGDGGRFRITSEMPERMHRQLVV